MKKVLFASATLFSVLALATPNNGNTQASPQSAKFADLSTLVCGHTGEYLTGFEDRQVVELKPDSSNILKATLTYDGQQIEVRREPHQMQDGEAMITIRDGNKAKVKLVENLNGKKESDRIQIKQGDDKDVSCQLVSERPLLLTEKVFAAYLKMPDDKKAFISSKEYFYMLNRQELTKTLKMFTPPNELADESSAQQ